MTCQSHLWLEALLPRLQTGESTHSSSPPPSFSSASTPSRSTGIPTSPSRLGTPWRITGYATRARTTSATCRSPSWTMWPTSTGFFSSLQYLSSLAASASIMHGVWAEILGNPLKSSTQQFCHQEFSFFLLCFLSAPSSPTSPATPWGTFGFQFTIQDPSHSKLKATELYYTSFIFEQGLCHETVGLTFKEVGRKSEMEKEKCCSSHHCSCRFYK